MWAYSVCIQLHICIYYTFVPIKGQLKYVKSLKICISYWKNEVQFSMMMLICVTFSGTAELLCLFLWVNSEFNV